MEKKIGYCPICDKEIFITTKASMIHCPTCGHHINLHPWHLTNKNEVLSGE